MPCSLGSARSSTRSSYIGRLFDFITPGDYYVSLIPPIVYGFLVHPLLYGWIGLTFLRGTATTQEAVGTT